MNENVLKVIKKEFESLTSIQNLAFEKDVNKDWIISAPTGSGKTEAVLFPIFSEILDKNLEKISCLYITPLRSLNRDLQRRIEKYCEFLNLEVDVRHGDTSSYQRKLQLQYPPDILITTVEMFQIILTAKKISEFLKNVRFVIIDEIHEILDSKRFSQLIFSIEKLKWINENFSIKILSATIGNIEKIEKLFKRKFLLIQAIEEKKFKFNVIYKGNFEERLKEIYDQVKNHETTLIFTNTRETAESLSKALKERYNDLKIETYHSSLEKEVRKEIEKKIIEKKIKSVITTSSLQLGIDIGHVDFVIQYQSPRQVNQLIQRVGRGSHKLNKISNGLIICSNIDDFLESCAIVKFALKNKIEDFNYFQNPLDILLHQIAGILIKEFKANLNELYEKIKKISIYENLQKDKFLEIIKFGESINIWKIENNFIKRKRKCFNYFFENLSTIPSQTEYKVVNIANKKSIGNLDEIFVESELEENKSFIIKGECWKVVNIDIEKSIVFVEESKDIKFAIPSWKGELLDVPFEVAVEASKMRESFDFDLSITDEKSIGEIKKILNKQKEISITPTNKKILVDINEDFVVINSPFGNKVNETFAILISSILSFKKMEKITYETSAYRIIIHSKIEKSLIEEILNLLKYYPIEKLIDESIKNSKLFISKFLEVAKRFGLIEEKNKLSKRMINSLIKEYFDSIVGEETINEIKTSKLDLEKAKEALKDAEIYFNDFLTPISQIEIAEKYGYVKIGEEKEIFEEFKKRIYNTKLFLICSNCEKFKISITVKNFDKVFPCPYCESIFLAPVKNLKRIDKSIKIASNFLVDYGKRFLIILAGRGIGIETAIRIITKNRFLSEDELLKVVYEEEKKYIRTRKYWKI